MRFQVGDKVKLSDAVAEFCGGELYEAPPGTTGVIREVHLAGGPNGVYGVELHDGIPNNALSGYHEHELLPLDESREEQHGGPIPAH